MKDYFQIKTWLITSIIIIVAVCLGLIVVFFFDDKKITQGSTDPSLFMLSGGGVWQRKHEIQINPDYVSGASQDTHANFPVYLNKSNFLSEVFTLAQSGGCDLRFSSDSEGNNEIAFELVDFFPAGGGNPERAEVWVKIPSLSAVATTSLWVWYDNDSAFCYADDYAYGSQNVWESNYKLVAHNAYDDSTSNSNDATQSADIVSVGGKLGQAYNFNGFSSYVYMGALGFTRSSGQPLSVSAWANAYGTDYHTVIAGTRLGSSGGDLWKIETYDTNWNFEYDTTGSGGRISPQAVQLNQWVMINGVYDGNNIIIYINGSYAGSISGYSNAYIDQDNFAIGRRADESGEWGEYFYGNIDEVRVSNMTKSSDCILTEYNNQNSPSTFAIPQPSCSDFDICGNGIDEDCNGSDAVCNCADIYNISGYAWSELYGWLSFNCNGDIYQNENYGVNINNDRNFEGYAWSSNLGWISFQENDLADYSFASNCNNTCDSSGNCTACLSGGKVYGWAKVVSLGSEGWIRFDDDNTGDGYDYGVSVDSSGDFSGWAWGDNPEEGGIGWVSFNSITDGSSYDYKVAYDNPIVAPVITNVEPTSGNKCGSLKIDWTYDEYAGTPAGFKVYNPPVVAGDEIFDLGPALRTYNDSGLALGETKTYVVCAYSGLLEECSSPESGTTLSFCEISGIIGSGECGDPDKIKLSWNLETGADYYRLKRCNETRTDCSNDFNYLEIDPADDCYEPGIARCVSGICSCENTSFVSGEEGDGYRYKVAGVVDIADPDPDEEGDWSDPTNVIVPCPGLPTWTEIKAE